MKSTCKFLTLLLIVLLATPPEALATFGAATAWDVRTTGVDTAGGAFDSGVGSPGTNESLGTGTAISVTLTGTTTGTGSPAFSSTTHGPGNFVHIASGSGCTTGWYEVLSQSSGTATFDHAMGTSTDVCVGTIGGSLLTIAAAVAVNVASNTIWIQAGTYTITSAIAPGAASGVSLTFNGYTTSHGDHGQATITTATNSIDLFDTDSVTGAQTWQDLILTNTAGTPLAAVQQITSTGTAWRFNHVAISGTADGINADNSGSHFQMNQISLFNVSITCAGGSGGTGRGVAQEGNALTVIGSRVSGCGTGLAAFSSNFIQMNVVRTVMVANGIGAKVYGNSFFTEDDFDSNVTDGILSGSGAIYANGCIFYGNGRAIDNTSGTFVNWENAPNAFGSNTSANVNWVGGALDVTFSGSPWVSSSNYTLSIPVGSAMKGTSFPGVTSYIGTGFADIGAIQTQASSSGGNAGASY